MKRGSHSAGYVIKLVVAVQLVAMLWYSAWVHSCAYNEAGRLASGVIHLRTLDFMLFTVNPPLPRMVAAVPVALSHAKTVERQSLGTIPTGRYEYAAGDCFVRDNAANFRFYLWLGRAAIAVFVVIGAWFTYVFGRALYGAASGLVALALWGTSPYIMGHGSLISPDVPAAAMGLAATYCFWQWLKDRTIYRAILAGLVLGSATLCKFTLIVLFPLFLLLWLLYRSSEEKMTSWKYWRGQCGQCGVLLFVSIYVINCGYVFEGTFTQLEDYRFRTTILTGCAALADIPVGGANRFDGTLVGKIPVPLPAAMIQGIDTQKRDFELGFPSYLRGRWADHGWWYYYLYALAIKVPLGTWLLLALAIGVTIFARGFNAPWRDEMVVLVPGLVIVIFVSSQTGFSVHSRYVIPALPFFFVWISKVGRIFQRRPRTQVRRVLAAAVVVALTWSVSSSLWVYPHSLSYFNELVGGPKNGGAHLLSSNIDWGQDLLYLKKWLDQHPHVRLDGLAFSRSCPATLAGIPQTPSPPSVDMTEHSEHDSTMQTADCGPQPGWYALSVNYLYDRSGQYRYFLKFEPVASAGYSIYIYHITLADANRVRAELEMPQLSDGNERSPR